MILRHPRAPSSWTVRGSIMFRLFSGLIAVVFCVSSGFAAEAIRLYAAGSLRAAMTDIANAYSATYGTPIEAVFGGTLGDRLAKGEAGGVFASAGMGNPGALTPAGEAGASGL